MKHKKEINEMLDKFLNDWYNQDNYSLRDYLPKFKKENGLIECEVGKVYKDPNSKRIFLVTKLNDDCTCYAYGFCGIGKYYENSLFGINNLVEATLKEWEERLTDYAINVLGFKEGVYFTEEFDTFNPPIGCGSKFVYNKTSFDKDTLRESNLCAKIYENGRWSKVIEEVKEEKRYIEITQGQKMKLANEVFDMINDMFEFKNIS